MAASAAGDSAIPGKRAGRRGECHQGEAGIRSQGGGVSLETPGKRTRPSWEAVRFEGVAGGGGAGGRRCSCFPEA